MGTVRWRVYAAPSYLERYGVPRSPADLAEHRCLNFLPGSYRSNWHLKEGDTLRTLAPVGAVSANGGDLLCALAVAGMGLVRLAEYRASADAPAGSLVTVLDDFEPEGDPMYAVYPSRRHLSLRVRAFLDHVGEHLSDSK